MKREWSNYSLDIFREYKETKNNLFIQAGPGSGKSTNLIELAKMTSPSKRSLFMAFNKSIAEELKERIPSYFETTTFHSKGLKTLFQNFNFKLKLNENKGFFFAKKSIKNSERKDLNEKQFFRYLFELQEIWNQVRVNFFVDYEREIPLICIEKDIEFRDYMVEDLKRIEEAWEKHSHLIKKGGDFMMDFTDMLWLPYRLIKEEDFPKYEVVFIDEGQDLNTLQREIALSFVKKGGRFVIVGDVSQCQPEGTKVLMSDGNYKNIEDLNIGDVVVSYEYRHDNCFIGNYSKILKTKPVLYKDLCERARSKVLNKAYREYEGDLYKLTAGNFSSSYTPNHICCVRWKPEIKTKYVLYLMQKGDWFRIGISPFGHNTSQSGGLLFRHNCEKADKTWILNIYDSREEARSQEMYYSYKFGIPQTIFERREEYGLGTISQELINSFYNRFEGELIERGISLLELFEKRIDCPFVWKEENKDSRWKVGKAYMFNTYACNVFPELMQVIIYDGFNYNKVSKGSRSRPIYKDIDKWEKTYYKGKVWSLEIDYFQNYVADGILTHNCIYHFQGADKSNFDIFKNQPRTTSLPLSITYRCGKNIVKEAQKVFPDNIEEWEHSPEGVVREGDLLEAREGDFVLCRNNLPLVEAFLLFLKNGHKASIKGKELGDALLSLMEKVNEVEELDVVLEEKLKTLMEKGCSLQAAKNNESYVALLEKVNIIKLLSKYYGDFQKTKDSITSIFDGDEKGIILCTCHRSKGLEADRVFLLDKNLIPSARASTQEALYAEKCLLFVAITRAKKELIYCYSK